MPRVSDCITFNIREILADRDGPPWSKVKKEAIMVESSYYYNVSIVRCGSGSRRLERVTSWPSGLRRWI
jgi:hypothetical protein